MKGHAPNTDNLLDHATGKMKPLEVVLMADGWEENATAAAACAVLMEQLGITPVLPRGDSHDAGDSCHSWPPLESDHLLTQNYVPKAEKHASGASATTAVTSSTVDGSATSAACGGCTTAGAVATPTRGPSRTLAMCRHPHKLFRRLAIAVPRRATWPALHAPRQQGLGRMVP